jgi:hypothetical protein
MVDNGLTQLHDMLTANGIPYWVDSGVLLGLIRNGELNHWEKDIDLAVCVESLGQVLNALKSLEDIGYSAVVNKYRSYIYSIGLKPNSAKSSAYLEASIHVFYSVGGYLWSPQPQFYIPPPAPDIRNRNRSFIGALLVSFISRRFFMRGKESQTLSASTISSKKSLLYKVLYSFYRVFDKRFFILCWPFSEVFTAFTWLLPKDLVLPLAELRLGSRTLPVPGRVEEYLTYRYGDWKVPRKEWFYWKDDASIVDEEPIIIRKKILGSR